MSPGVLSGGDEGCMGRRNGVTHLSTGIFFYRLALDAVTRKLNTSKKENRGLEEEVNVAQAR